MSERYCKDCRYCHHANIGLLCMGRKGMPHTSPYWSCDSWKSAKQTNADRIRAMTDEELADLYMKAIEDEEYPGWWGNRMGLLAWLKQEAKT